MRAFKKIVRVPAIRTPNGNVVQGKRGDRHKDIIDNLPHKPRGNVEHGFIDNLGRFLTRTEARQQLRQKTGVSLGVGRPSSEDLMKKKPAKKKKPGY